ncbi:MAG: CHASE2 domain-containing protein [Treponema sp.]|nr:CHASE2 domain-containing protein [Treponema sp.]
MKKKNFVITTFITALIKIIIFLVFGTLCFFNIFQKLDYRLYDSLSQLRKEPPLDENIMLVKIDDVSINDLGEWPWTRDVIADALLRMKELGTESAIFDIEYISPSKNGIAPNAEAKVSSKIFDTQDEVAVLIDQFSNAIANGYYSINDVTELSGEMLNENVYPIFEDLNDYIVNNMSRNNDEYFAQCLQFFGKSYLTINHGDLGYPVTRDDVDYIENRFLQLDVNDPKYLINIGNDITAKEADEVTGFTPALHSLLTRSYGANFTNSVIDNDGVRRRMELLFEHDNHYIPQLAFGPYLDLVGSHKLSRKNNELIVHDATNPYTGVTGDIKIPLDNYGRMLIDWRRGSIGKQLENPNLKFFKSESFVKLINLDRNENAIFETLNNIWSQPIIADDGFVMDYVNDTQALLEQYISISIMKDDLLAKCTGFNLDNSVIDGISQEEYDEYFALRNAFYENVQTFINTDYVAGILERLDELSELYDDDIINEYKTNLPYDFNFLKVEFEDFYEELNQLKNVFNGAYCIIGNTATSTTDLGATPFEKKFENVAIHANVLNTLLTESFITVIPWHYGFILAAALAFLMLVLSAMPNLWQNLLAFIFYLTYCLVWGGLFVYSVYYIPFIGTIFYLAADLLGCLAYRFYQSVKEKQFITQIAASFANKDTVEELRRNPDAFKTEGQKKTITALFSDVQKFSTLSESIGKMYGDEGPNKLIEILNEYLGQMSDEILNNGGNIDKYEGDAIISMFGAPDPMNTHTPAEWAYLCLDSAIKMKEVEVEFNHIHKELFVPKEIVTPKGKELIQLKPLQTRIGVNSGEAFVGLMGSKTETFSKLNYTMIGDTVNLASRLEGVNKAYNSWIMCSDATWNLANSGENANKLVARRLDQVRVVGRSTPVQLYNIIGFTSKLSSSEKEKIDIFHAGLDKYLARDFIGAGKLFMQANAIEGGDPTSLVFADRCKKFIEDGIPENWDGVINMTSK